MSQAPECVSSYAYILHVCPHTPISYLCVLILLCIYARVTGACDRRRMQRIRDVCNAYATAPRRPPALHTSPVTLARARVALLASYMHERHRRRMRCIRRVCVAYVAYAFARVAGELHFFEA
jgi:hypothetical protein